jgi:hypothetical protein
MNIVRSCIYALALLATPALADVTATEEFKYPLNEGGRISLDNVNGDIRITGGSGSEVVIVATKRAGKQDYLDRLEILIEASEDAIRIETRHPENAGRMWGWNDGGGSVSYELSVPSSARLDGIGTVNGDIGITGIGGEVRAKTVNGSLALESLAGDARLETVNGAITAAFQTVGNGQRIAADTVNGKIIVRLPANASAHVTADTLNGSLDGSDFGLEATKGFVGRDLDGRIGAGEARIQLDTVNGSIRIEKL